MSALVSHLSTGTARRRSARLQSSVEGDSAPKPIPFPRKRKRIEGNEPASVGLQGRRDFQTPDTPTLELSPKYQKRGSRKRKANEFDESRESGETFPKFGEELQPNLSPVYTIPDVEKKKIYFHGRLGVFQSFGMQNVKLTLFQPTRLRLSEHRPSKKEACC